MDNFRQFYIKRAYSDLAKYSSWGIKLEALFRGFNHREMLEIQGEILSLVAKKRRQYCRINPLREVTIKTITTNPFKDQLVL